MDEAHAPRALTLAGVLIVGAVMGAAGYAALAAAPESPGIDPADRQLLRELAAKDEIRAQIYNYARGLDRMDMELAKRVWHRDGTADYIGTYQGSGAGFVDMVWPFHAQLTAHSHQITNVLIEVEGDTAVSEAYVMASLHTQTADGAETPLVRSRYADTWSKRDGRWAIDHRIAITDFRTLSVADDPGEPTEGLRDRSDPSYRAYPF